MDLLKEVIRLGYYLHRTLVLHLRFHHDLLSFLMNHLVRVRLHHHLHLRPRLLLNKYSRLYHKLLRHLHLPRLHLNHLLRGVPT